jgi:predicted RNA binding protein YcfA (HicA-like mRNA interferase family)
VSILPQVSGQRLIRALERGGFLKVNSLGGHVTLAHREDPTRIAVVPMHGAKPIKPGTLRAILRGARVTVEELRALI